MKIEIDFNVRVKNKYQYLFLKMSDFVLRLVNEFQEKEEVFVDFINSHVIDDNDIYETPGINSQWYRNEQNVLVLKFNINEVDWVYKCSDTTGLFFSNAWKEWRNIFLISDVYIKSRDGKLSKMILALSRNFHYAGIRSKFELIITGETTEFMRNVLPYFTKLKEGEIFGSGRLTKGTR